MRPPRIHYTDPASRARHATIGTWPAPKKHVLPNRGAKRRERERLKQIGLDKPTQLTA